MEDRSMQRPRSLIFRSEALEHYIQSREKNILPRITTPPVFLCMWILLGLCVIAVVVASLSQVPVYSSGSGVVLEGDTSVLVFFPTSPVHPVLIHAGEPIHLQIGTFGQNISSTIDKVETGVLSPAAIQKRYRLSVQVAQLIAEPSIVAAVKLNGTFPSGSYAGSIVTVQVQVGTTRVLALVLGSIMLNGEE
jgi:hypothetical protein